MEHQEPTEIWRRRLIMTSNCNYLHGCEDLQKMNKALLEKHRVSNFNEVITPVCYKLCPMIRGGNRVGAHRICVYGGGGPVSVPVHPGFRGRRYFIRRITDFEDFLPSQKAGTFMSAKFTSYCSAQEWQKQKHRRKFLEAS